MRIDDILFSLDPGNKPLLEKIVSKVTVILKRPAMPVEIFYYLVAHLMAYKALVKDRTDLKLADSLAFFVFSRRMGIDIEDLKGLGNLANTICTELQENKPSDKLYGQFSALMSKKGAGIIKISCDLLSEEYRRCTGKGADDFYANLGAVLGERTNAAYKNIGSKFKGFNRDTSFFYPERDLDRVPKGIGSNGFIAKCFVFWLLKEENQKKYYAELPVTF